MKRTIILLSILLSIGLFVSPAVATEIVRQKNAATYIFFPIVDGSGDTITGAAGLDSEVDTFADGSAPDGFADLTNEATEIGATGWYYISLTQAEMNVDYMAIRVQSSTGTAITQRILIRTTTGDPLLMATTDDGGTINVTSGKIDEVNKLTEFDEDNTTIDINATTLGTVSTLTGHTAQTANHTSSISSILTDTETTLDTLVKDIPTTAELALRTLLAADYVVVGDTIAGVTDVSNDVGITQAGADKVWGTAARVLTAGTNLNDIEVNVTAMAANVLTASALNADAVTEIIDNFETQSQADPTGFHVNMMEVEGTAGKAAINTEVADVLTTDTVSEMAQGAPPGSPTMEQILNYLYRYLRNKTETSGATISVYNDAGDTVIFKASISDDGTTFTKAEHVTGP